MAVAGDFFERQRVNRRQSGWLLVLFLIALLVMAGIITLVAGALTSLLGQSGDNAWLAPQTLIFGGLMFGVVLLGSLFRLLEMKNGAAALASHFGAAEVKRNRGTRSERQLLGVVEEMAIAARQPQPSVWVMPRERAINAFTAAARNRQYMIVVTQGAIEQLEREELQGVIAHEFGHIANGDVPLNMRMLVAFSGLLAIDQVGRILGGNKIDDHGLTPVHALGWLLIMLGSAGVLASGLIRAAFGRRRELLADDTAVQFTRYPEGLAAALDKVREHPQGSHLTGSYAGELAHLCLLPVERRPLFRRWFNVHPSIESRIARISPGFERRKRKHEQAETQPESVSGSMGYAAISEDVQVGDNVTGSALPDALMIALPDTDSFEAALYALLLIHFEGSRRLFAQALALHGFEKRAGLALELAEKFPRELDHFAVEIIHETSTRLIAQRDTGFRDALLERLKKYARLDGSLNLHEFVLLSLMHNALRGAPVGETEDKQSHEAMGVVVSLLTEAAGYAESRRQATVKSFMGLYGGRDIPLTSLDDPNCVDRLANALSVLHKQMPAVRQNFVRHAAELVLEDGHITSAEKNLLHLIAAALAVSLPRLN